MAARTPWKAPLIHSDYGQLRQTLEQRASAPGGIDAHQADVVHRRWRQIGKLAQAGRL